ncbi:hypothetical protein C6P42_000558 [Pichia californica]|nr:hypothetical protein C6P42_000558 [[Candida] californica]
MMRLSIPNLLAFTSSCIAYTFNTSDIVDYNVTRSSYHIDVNNATEYDYWSLLSTNASQSYANGTGITIAMIGDGINKNLLSSPNSVSSVFDIYTNKSFIFTNENEITEDTLAAKVLLSNSPNSIIKSFKIFENFNSTTTLISKLINALNIAINDNSIDLIFINTWQSYGGWKDSNFSKFLNKISKIKPIILPMGQNNGIFQFSDGAGAENVISVGSSGFDGTPGYSINIENEFYGIYANNYLNLYSNNTLILGELDDNCYLKNNISYNFNDLLFIDVGNCSSNQIVNAVLLSNFTQLLTTGETYQIYSFDEVDNEIVSGMITRNEGLKILELLEEDEIIIAHSNSNENSIVIDKIFDEFSINFNQSMGPTLDLNLKPNIIAQGSFFFDDLSIYGSGTSLSAAYVVGVIAAYASYENNNSNNNSNNKSLLSWSNNLINRITTSGTKINFRNLIETFSEIHNPVVQGGGIINVEEFILKDFDISPGYFSLGETNSTTSITFTINNNNENQDKRFYISGLDSITIYSQDENIDANDYNMYSYPIYGNSTFANLKIEKSTILVKAGMSKNVTVLITPPNNNFKNEEFRIPIYGGYIQIEDLSNNFISSIPYFGITVAMHSLETQTDEEFYWKEFHYELDDKYCEMWVNASIINDTNHYLQIYFGDRIGSPMVDILVVNKDWTKDDFIYPPIPGKNNFVERIKGTRYPGNYPLEYVPRTNISLPNQWDDWHYGLLNDDTILPNGDYKIILRILKHNYIDIGNWDEWYNHISPWFSINYENVTDVELPLTTISITHESTTLNTIMTSSLDISSSAAATITTSDSMAGMHML